MISKTAIEDIEALRADGIDVPPREVVRLNVLGLRVERGPDSPDVFAAPRVAFLGDVVLREPPLGADMWMCQALDLFDAEDAQTWFVLRVLICSVPWRELPDPTAERAVRKAMKAAMKRLSDATLRQVANALDWCTEGNLPETGEKPPPRPVESDSSDSDDDDLPPRYSFEFGLFWRGRTLRLGTADELKDMSKSALMAACDQAARDSAASSLGGIDFKAEKGRAYGDYMRALDAVRAAHAPNQASTKAAPTYMPTMVRSTARQQIRSSEASGPSGKTGSLPSSGSTSLGRGQTTSIGVMSDGV